MEIMQSVPRVELSEDDVVRHVAAYLRRKPETTIKELAELMCRSPIYTRKIISKAKEYNKERSKT